MQALQIVPILRSQNLSILVAGPQDRGEVPGSLREAQWSR
jgi:hypothetical protein